ncbi:unnamed protein product [Sphagnum jensenii]|uniref:Uncharacterized protein n=1 Tax=Sphagnum jensenii TaxID=128206 RepID=A0ABP0X3N8_9BRYO
MNSCSGQKFEYALRHGLHRGLLVVTLPWFLNSAKHYGTRLYVDPDLLSEVQDKVQESAESCGATHVEIWSKKNNATHVVCESRALPKYIGLNLHLVSHSLGLMDGYLACSGAGAHLVKGWAIFLNRSIFLTPEVFVTNKKKMKSYGLKDKPNQIKKGLTQELKAINPGERVIFVGTTSKPWHSSAI